MPPADLHALELPISLIIFATLRNSEHGEVRTEGSE
jgi:hypothetical protein